MAAPHPRDDAPSERDRQVYEAHRVQCRSAEAVGKKFDLAPAEIREICARVQRRLANQSELERAVQLLRHREYLEQQVLDVLARVRTPGPDTIETVTTETVHRPGKEPVTKVTRKVSPVRPDPKRAAQCDRLERDLRKQLAVIQADLPQLREAVRKAKDKQWLKERAEQQRRAKEQDAQRKQAIEEMQQWDLEQDPGALVGSAPDSQGRTSAEEAALSALLEDRWARLRPRPQ